MNRHQQALAPTHTELAGLGLQKDTKVVLIVGRCQTGGTLNGGIQGIQEGAALYEFPDSPQRLIVTSSDANDTAGGIGVTGILIQGLDPDYKDIVEFVTMDGLNPVLTTQTFIRVQAATSIDAGAAAVNIGNISLHMEITNERIAFISAGLGQSVLGNYTVPADKRFLVRSVYVSAARNDETELYYTQRNFGNTAFSSVPAGLMYESFGQINDILLAIPAKADFMLTMNPLVNNPNLVVSMVGTLYDFNENSTTI